MRGIVHIIATIAATVLLLYCLKEWFGWEQPWMACLICFLLPAFSFLLLRDDNGTEITYRIKHEKIVDLQTKELFINYFSFLLV